MSLIEICLKYMRIVLSTGLSTSAKPFWCLDSLISCCMADVYIKNILYLKYVINVNKYRLRGCVRNMFNTHYPVTALLGWVKLSSDC